MEKLRLQSKLQPALLEGETIEWVDRPTELHWVMKRFWKVHDCVVVIVPILAVISEILYPWLLKGKPFSFPETWSVPAILLAFVVIFGFRYLWMRQFKSTRYIVTNKRALIYFPKWGASWNWSPKKGFRRDYTDPEYSPISGGYISQNTAVQRDSINGTYDIINMTNMMSDMSDAKTISFIKKIIPSLDGIIYDPANLQFGGLADAVRAEKDISKIVETIKRDLKTED